jgi:methyltransferase-like protein
MNERHSKKILIWIIFQDFRALWKSAISINEVTSDVVKDLHQSDIGNFGCTLKEIYLFDFPAKTAIVDSHEKGIRQKKFDELLKLLYDIK